MPGTIRIRRRALRALPVIFGVAALAVAAPSLGALQPQLLLNITPSEPMGLYRRLPAASPLRGAIVSFPPPLAARTLQAGRFAHMNSFLKEVAAVEGDQVCVRGGQVRINGQPRGWAAPSDRQGRPLPQWRGCRRMGYDDLFVFSTRAPNSFDSRYFGPISRASVLGVYAPLWVEPSLAAARP